MTTGPDSIVENRGESITHIQVYIATENGTETYRTEDVTQSKAIVSSPTEEDIQQLEGRVDSTTFKLTVPSSLDVQLFRETDNLNSHYARDEFVVRGQLCEVASGGISDDAHPITGTDKQTVVVQAVNRDRIDDGESSTFDVTFDGGLA